MRLLKFGILSCLILSSLTSFSQSMQINNVQGCVGDTVSATISMSAMDSVGAITLYIGFDTSKLKFLNLENINPSANGTMFNNMHSGAGSSGQLLGKIAISWVTTSGPVNFVQGTFGMLKFQILGGNSNLTFSNDCEIANYMSQVITVAYTNGSINLPPPPLVLNQPNLNIIDFQNANIRISSQNSTIRNWQIKNGNNWSDIQNNNDYQNVNSDTLVLKHFNTILNITYFRCKLGNSCETIYSDSIPVISNGINVEKMNDFHIYPNPFTDNLIISNANLSDFAEIRILQMDGRVVKIINGTSQCKTMFINDLNKLPKGIYFLEIIPNNFDKQRDMQPYKLIKN